MTLSTRVMLSSFMVAAAGALATPAQAQPISLSIIHREPSVAVIAPEPGRIIDGYYSHYRFDTPGSRTGMSGIGARVMWNPARADYGATALPSRFAFGLFGEYAPNQENKSFSVGHVGVQGDVNVFQTPLFGRVLPVASLGAGMLWTDRAGPAVSSPEFSLANRSIRSFALSPSIGTRVGLWRQLSLRADARDLVTFKDQALHHIQFAAGLSFAY